MRYQKIDFVMAASEQGLFIINRNDMAPTTDGRYFGVAHSLMVNGSYEDGEIGACAQIMKLRRDHYGEGVVALDCGANIGINTVCWAKTMTGWGQVVAIEPQERIYYALAGNIAINNCYNAQPLMAVVGAETGVMDIPIPNYSAAMSYGSLELREDPNNEAIGQDVDYHSNLATVRLLTLDSLRLSRIDFIKIDVERMEFDVLSGADNVLKQHKPTMMIEIMKLDANCLVALLDQYGYDCFPSSCNLLAIHREDNIRPYVTPDTLNAR